MDRKKLKEKIRKNSVGVMLVLGLIGTSGKLLYELTSFSHEKQTPQEVCDTPANDLMFKAIARNNLEEFKQALKSGADLRALNLNNDDCLIAALRQMIGQNESEIVNYILTTPEIRKQINFEATNNQGHNAIDMMKAVIQHRTHENNPGLKRKIGKPATEYQKSVLKQIEDYTREYSQQKEAGKTSFAFHQRMMKSKTTER